MTCSDAALASSGYARYLTAKTTVDDRALNRQVLAELGRLMPAVRRGCWRSAPAWGRWWPGCWTGESSSAGEYILLDADRQLLECSRRWLRDWAAARGLRSDLRPDGLQVGDLRVRLVHAELGDYLAAAATEPADVLIANAVLDLVDVPAVLPGLLRLLVPGGVYWFTINYDGESIFAPGHRHDDQVMRPTTATWTSASATAGQPAKAARAAACSTTCATAGAPALAAGSSDWVVTRPRTGATRPTRRTSCAAS